MSLLDISIITVLSVGALRGLFRGLIKEVATLTAIILGGWLAYSFHLSFSVLLNPFMPQPAARVVAFVLLLLLVGFVAHLAGNLLTKVVKLALLGWVNRIAGFLVGLLEGLIILCMLFYAIMAVPFKFQIKETISKHAGANQLAGFGGILLDRAKSMRPSIP